MLLTMMATHITAPQNPFRFGSLALDDAFADREAEVQELKFDVRNGQDVVIFAPRRFGKSSLVWKVMRQLTDEGVLVAYVNLMTTPSKARLAGRLAAAVHGSIASPLERAREAALAPFRGLRVVPQISVDPGDGDLTFSFGVEHSDADIDATIERLLELLGELGAGRKRRVALILDEFQEIESIDAGLPRLMRTIFEQQPEVAHVYLGSRRHMMERIFNDENEPFWRSAKRTELGLIDPALFSPFLAARFAKTNKRAGEEALAAVLERTAGHPYATQELCYFLWEETPFDGVAGGAELERAVDAVLRSENSHFQLRWEGASAAQKLVLQALALEPGRPLASAYRVRHRLPSAATVQTALRVLVERELVARGPDGSHYVFEPFLGDWLRAMD